MKRLKGSYTHNPKNLSHRLKVRIKKAAQAAMQNESLFFDGRAYFLNNEDEEIDLGNCPGGVIMEVTSKVYKY